MPTPIYLRKSGDDKVRLHALAEVTEETGSRLEFQSETHISVDSQSHYYVARRNDDGVRELWLVQLHESSQGQEPYTYTAVISRKYRDVSDGWIQDD